MTKITIFLKERHLSDIDNKLDELAGINTSKVDSTDTLLIKVSVDGEYIGYCINSEAPLNNKSSGEIHIRFMGLNSDLSEAKDDALVLVHENDVGDQKKYKDSAGILANSKHPNFYPFTGGTNSVFVTFQDLIDSINKDKDKFYAMLAILLSGWLIPMKFLFLPAYWIAEENNDGQAQVDMGVFNTLDKYGNNIGEWKDLMEDYFTPEGELISELIPGKEKEMCKKYKELCGVH